MTTYELATPADDATLRALLRENTMPSWVTLSLEREPSYFAGFGKFGLDWAVIAREKGKPVGMYSCAEQRLHANGEAVTVGYLGALRVQPEFRNRLRILREGYASIPRLNPLANPTHWYTSIASENAVARRLLEANLPGMPRYHVSNEMVTLALPKSRGVRRHLWHPLEPSDLEHLCEFYNQHACGYQFSPALTPEIAGRTGADFFKIEQDGALVACMALWRQDYKQVVARAYRTPMAIFRPVYNVYARVARRVALPRLGEALEQTNLAFLAAAPTLDVTPRALVEDALARCATQTLTLGLWSGHPWLDALVSTFRPWTYRTQIYTVRFDEGASLDGRPAQPEVALL